MNYQKIYNDICKRGQERKLPKDVYTEKHHIVPRCLGSGNEKSNISVLTAREHFLVHYILASKLYPTNSKIWHACFKMCSASKDQKRFIPNSKLYEEIKISWSKLNRGSNHFAFGKPKSDEHKKAIGDSQRGKIITKESLEKRKITNANKPPQTVSGERKQFLSEYFINNNPNSQSCSIEGIEFKSLSAAGRYFDVSAKILKARINSNDSIWENWKFTSESKINENTRDKIRQKAIGRTHTDETKSKIGKSGKENNFYGKKHTDETKDKLRKHRVGKRLSEDTKHKISIANSGENNHFYGVTGADNPLYGYKHTDKFCKDIQIRQQGESNSFYGKHHSDSTRQHLADISTNSRKCIVDGVIYNSIKSVARLFNITPNTAKNRMLSSNFPTWEFFNNDNNSTI